MSMLEDLTRQLEGKGIGTISRSLGLAEDQVTKVVSGALPAPAWGPRPQRVLFPWLTPSF